MKNTLILIPFVSLLFIMILFYHASVQADSKLKMACFNGDMKACDKMDQIKKVEDERLKEAEITSHLQGLNSASSDSEEDGEGENGSENASSSADGESAASGSSKNRPGGSDEIAKKRLEEYRKANAEIDKKVEMFDVSKVSEKEIKHIRETVLSNPRNTYFKKILEKIDRSRAEQD